MKALEIVGALKEFRKIGDKYGITQAVTSTSQIALLHN